MSYFGRREEKNQVRWGEMKPRKVLEDKKFIKIKFKHLSPT
jgi:hypothetical protein